MSESDRTIDELLERFALSRTGGKARRPDYVSTMVSAAEGARLADYIDGLRAARGLKLKNGEIAAADGTLAVHTGTIYRLSSITSAGATYRAWHGADWSSEMPMGQYFERLATAADIAPTTIPLADIPPALRAEVERLRAAATPWTQGEMVALRPTCMQIADGPWRPITSIEPHGIRCRFDRDDSSWFEFSETDTDVTIQLSDGRLVGARRETLTPAKF